MNRKQHYRQYHRDQQAAKQRLFPAGSIVQLHKSRRFKVTKEGIVLGACIAVAICAVIWVAAILTA